MHIKTLGEMGLLKQLSSAQTKMLVWNTTSNAFAYLFVSIIFDYFAQNLNAATVGGNFKAW